MLSQNSNRRRTLCLHSNILKREWQPLGEEISEEMYLEMGEEMQEKHGEDVSRYMKRSTALEERGRRQCWGHGWRQTLQEGNPYWGRDTPEELQPVKVPHQGGDTGKPGGTLTSKQRAADKKH